MASYSDVLQLSDLRSLATYILGLLIIVMYSKDKFNMPTYDKESVGPFAQLPPQSLTIDSRYQWGRMVYVFLLAALYTAICIIGPTIFNFDQSNATQNKLSLVASAQTWQVGAATFLISTGAARDDSLLGRIELFIRQYAHKIAYIPSAVSDLAFSLRNLKIDTWLLGDATADQGKIIEREAALTGLVGAESIKKFEKNPEQEGEIAAWLRANILFFTLSQVFNKSPGISNPRLDNLTDLQENREAFERLQNTQRSLLTQVGSTDRREDEGPDGLYAEVQRFAKEVSLTIAVLLSRTARNGNDLAQRLDQLGFSNAYENNQSDHFGYVFFVNAFIFCGAIVSAVFLFAPMLYRASGVAWTDRYLLQGFLTILTGLLIYVVTFRVLDNSRDKLLEMQDWKESLESYSTIAPSASVLSSVICIVSVTLIFSLFNWLQYIAYNPMSFISFILFNTIVAAVGTGFGLRYFRQAARLPRARLSLPASLLNGAALMHACMAALLVGFLNTASYSYQASTAPKEFLNRVKADFSALQPIVEHKPQDSKAVYALVSPADMKSISKNLNTLDNLLTAGADQIEKQLKQVTGICTLLSSRYDTADKATPPEAPNIDDSDDPVRLFDNAKQCVLGSLLNFHPTNNPSPPAGVKDNAVQQQAETARNEGLFSSFVYSLPQLYAVIGAAKGGRGSWMAEYQTWIFPTIVTFIIAFGFGVGSRYWRAWWLYNEVDRAEGNGQKLREQIHKFYGDKVDFEKCLVFPISSLGYITPLEALRYEDYRVRLFAKIQRKQIDWEGCESKLEDTTLQLPTAPVA
jgi:hypothetical protein